MTSTAEQKWNCTNTVTGDKSIKNVIIIHWLRQLAENGRSNEARPRFLNRPVMGKMNCFKHARFFILCIFQGGKARQYLERLLLAKRSKTFRFFRKVSSIILVPIRNFKWLWAKIVILLVKIT